MFLFFQLNVLLVSTLMLQTQRRVFHVQLGHTKMWQDQQVALLVHGDFQLSMLEVIIQPIAMVGELIILNDSRKYWHLRAHLWYDIVYIHLLILMKIIHLQLFVGLDLNQIPQTHLSVQSAKSGTSAQSIHLTHAQYVPTTSLHQQLPAQVQMIVTVSILDCEIIHFTVL